MDQPKVRDRFCRLINDKRTVSGVVKFLQKLGRLEVTIPLEKKLLATRPSTIEVLNAQIHEILTTEFEVSPTKFQTPCYFAMSVLQPGNPHLHRLQGHTELPAAPVQQSTPELFPR